MTERAKAVNLTEQVYDALRRDILSGRYQKGDALTEMGVADELNVSRTPVREALRQLEQEELVAIRPNRGAVVVGIEKMDFQDIYYIRSLIEGIAAERAANTASDEDIRALEERVELMEFYLEKKNYEKMLEMDDSFHHMLYELSGSRMLARILKELHIYAAMIRQASMRQEGRAEHTVREHRAIYEAIAQHDGATAKACAIAHISHTMENITDNHLI